MQEACLTLSLDRLTSILDEKLQNAKGANRILSQQMMALAGKDDRDGSSFVTRDSLQTVLGKQRVVSEVEPERLCAGLH